VTNAKGGESLHNYGVAVDFTFVQYGYNATEQMWQSLGHVAESKGFEWGGRWTSFPDRPHCQLMLGYTLADFKTGKVDYDKYK
jgi:peptidoglycan L-alanyl-D-glutamate endopeptidase CwlK